MSTDTSDAPYTLVQIDSAATGLPAAAPLSLSWHNISVRSAAASTKTTPAKQPPSPQGPPHDIKLQLDDISGEAIAGELLAIAGPSRATTSALLDTIAGHAPAAAATGVVRVNHQPMRLTPAIAGYVSKAYPMYATLTVYEHLQLQARLRLGDASTAGERASRVDQVLQETGLANVARSLVGDGTNGNPTAISARDHKLLSIATELITTPSILLLDEPTAGLDAFSGDAVVRCLQSLARKGHTVVLAATLDQLTSNTFTLVDKLHVLTGGGAGDDASGRTVFRGKPIDSLAFFQSNELPCPPHTNPFEFLMQELFVTGPKDAARVHQLVRTWGDSVHLSRATVGALQTVDATPVLGSHEGDWVAHGPKNSIGTQLRVLLQRNMLRLSHNVPEVRARIVKALVIALVIGLIFLRIDVSQNHVQSFSSACFFITASQFITNALPELSSIPKEVAIVLREHAGRQYHALSWYVVKNVSEVPLQVLYSLVFLTPTYFLVGFPADATVFFSFLLFVFLVVSTGVAVGLFSACVASKPKLVLVLGIAIIAPSMIFGGTFVNRKTTPGYFVWLQQILPVKYCYHGLMRAFWGQVGEIYCAPGAVCRATSGRAVLAMNVVKAGAFASDWQLLLAINLALRVLGGLALWRRATRY